MKLRTRIVGCCFLIASVACGSTSDSTPQADAGVGDAASGLDAGNDAASASDAGIDALADSSVDSAADAPPAWNPTALGAVLSLWLDPNVGVTSSNGRVVLWADQSGRTPANNAGASPGAGPAVATHGGHTVLRWDASTTVLSIPDATSLQLGAEFTVEMVVSSNGPATGGGVIWNKGPGSMPTMELSFTTSSVYLNDPYAPLQMAISTTAGYTDGNLHYVGVRRTAGKTEVRVDGVATTPGTYPQSGWVGYAIRLGQGISGGFLGDIADVVAVNGALSASDLAKLEGYLKAKHGL